MQTTKKDEAQWFDPSMEQKIMFGFRFRRRYISRLNMMDSQTLMAEYAKNGSESAFRELVARYIDLVYSTALRSVGGDTHLAEDVAQTVFIHLAQKAKRLPTNVLLGGWLHRDACYVAATVLRSQRRRKTREKQAVEMNELQNNREDNLEKVTPILDEAINKLNPQDRAAIMLRFFEQQDLRSVGIALGSNEDAARMRVNRALEKLHAMLKRRGVALSSITLGTMLATKAVIAAPAGLAASVAASAFSTAIAGGGILFTIHNILTMTKIKLGIATAIVAAGVITPLSIQHQNQIKLQEENTALRQKSKQLEAEAMRLANQAAQSSNHEPIGQEQLKELLKLRGEVGLLKKQLAELQQRKDQAANPEPVPNPQPAVSPEVEKEKALMKQQAIAKMNYSRNWMMAFMLYADKNQGTLPTNFDQAASLLPDNAKEETMLATNHFEITYQGSLKNIAHPESVFIIREAQSFSSPAGGYNRTYVFADGHSEVHHENEDNFQAWEAQHSVSTAN